MTTAVIGSGGIGSAIARLLASGGESLRLSSTDDKSVQKLAEQIGRGANATTDNRKALEGADAVILGLRFTVLEAVLDQIADVVSDKLVVVPSNPVGLDNDGNVVRLLPAGQSSGEIVAGWLPEGTDLAMAFGSMSADLLEASSNRSPESAVLFYATDNTDAGERVERLIRIAGFEPIRVGGVDQSDRLEVGGDLHDRVVDAARGRSLINPSS